MLVVALGAAGFGFALFGRRPVPQTATQWSAGRRGAAPDGPATPPSTVMARVGDAVRATVASADEVVPTRWVRIRAAILLGLTVLGLAATIGGVLSIVVVGLVLLVT